MTAGAEKACSRCRLVLPLDRFSRRNDRPNSSCRACVVAATRAWKQANPEKHAAQRERVRESGKQREYDLRRYNMTPADYDRLLEAQGGTCAICGVVSGSRSGRRLVVDHNHATGRVRGLLCFRCNTAIGKLGDSVHGLRNALAYLERAGD